jgi:hypothetical protein
MQHLALLQPNWGVFLAEDGLLMLLFNNMLSFYEELERETEMA